MEIFYKKFMTDIEMEKRLRKVYPTAHVAVVDLTGGGNHYEVRISSQEMENLSRMEQHQAIMSVFDNELKSGEVHALAIKVLKN